jgi:hypothetical protein
MGIGWPLRAIFIFVFSILPVFFLTFLINEIIDTKIIKKRNIMKKVFK